MVRDPSLTIVAGCPSPAVAVPACFPHPELQPVPDATANTMQDNGDLNSIPNPNRNPNPNIAGQLGARLASLPLLHSTLDRDSFGLQDYPEHRLQFFSLLHAITRHCFQTLLTMSPPQLKLVIDSIIWAFRHTEARLRAKGSGYTAMLLPLTKLVINSVS